MRDLTEEQKAERRRGKREIRKLLSKVVLKELKDYKKKTGIWDMVALELGLRKRTIMRWLKTGIMSWAHIELLQYKLKIPNDKLRIPERLLRYIRDEDSDFEQ